MRMGISVQIALDFVECTKSQKQSFINFLESKNWLPLNQNKLWEVNCVEHINSEDLIKNINQQIIEAKEYSKLYELDYFIFSDEKFYFNQLS